MRNKLHAEVTCPQCESDFWISVIPEVQAKTWGPPENCYPTEPAEIDPDNCPACGHDFTPEEEEKFLEETRRQNEFE